MQSNVCNCMQTLLFTHLRYHTMHIHDYENLKASPYSSIHFALVLYRDDKIELRYNIKTNKWR